VKPKDLQSRSEHRRVASVTSTRTSAVQNLNADITNMYFTRTLTALIHAAFSHLVNALHSLRTAGVEQVSFL
jgi:hypothetical protein